MTEPTAPRPRPDRRPERPFFSSGPCAKRPGWSLDALSGAVLGRSHRSAEGKARLQESIDRTAAILGVPDGYRVGIVPGSDTGAVEMAMWSLLGPRPVAVVAFDAFGRDWLKDCCDQLQLEDVSEHTADYGTLPDLSAVDTGTRDVVMVWNGTTSGVRVPDADWIADDREGLMICDATSAAFAQPLPWDRLDVVTYSWQKVLGGEAAHGMLILSPRAVERLESFTPERPLPKIFRLTKGGKLNEGIFRGSTINTPSMLCVEDYLDALSWAEGLGGVEALWRRADANLAAVASWVEKTPWAEFLADDPATRSNTSVCLALTGPRVEALGDDARAALPKKIAQLLADEGVAYDVASYRDAPAGLRVWCGATVDTADVEALMPWVTWAFEEAVEGM